MALSGGDRDTRTMGNLGAMELSRNFKIKNILNFVDFPIFNSQALIVTIALLDTSKSIIAAQCYLDHSM